MNNITPLNEIIKLKRKEKGYSLRTLANITGLSHTYINQLEKNKVKEPSFTTILKLSKKLDFDIHPYIKDPHIIDILHKDPDIIDLLHPDFDEQELELAMEYPKDTKFEVIEGILEECEYEIIYHSANGNTETIEYSSNDIVEITNDIITVKVPVDKFLELGMDMVKNLRRFQRFSVDEFVNHFKNNS